MMDSHLTSEQMEELLMEPEAIGRSQHLAQCDGCTAEFESLRATIGDLRTAVAGYAGQHHRAAELPAISYARPRPMWGLAMAAGAALLCVTSSLVWHERASHVAPVIVSQQQAEGADSDEQMMSNVQDDLSASVPQPMLPLASSNATDSTSGAKETE
jgi:hypothetical protein